MAKMNYSHFKEEGYEDDCMIPPIEKKEVPKKASEIIRDYAHSCAKQSDDYARLGHQRLADHFRDSAPRFLKRAEELEKIGM